MSTAVCTLDYEAEAQKITDLFLHSVVEGPTEWKMVKNSDGVQVYSKKSEEMKGHVLKSEVTLPVRPEHLVSVLTPLKPYRLQWDKHFVETIDILSRVSNSKPVYLVHHVCPPVLKGLISARDSIDLVTLGETDSYYYVAAGGTEHPSYPPVSNYIRTHQYPGGYVVYKDSQKPDECKFVMVFHLDLNMNGLGSMVADMTKPSLLIQQVNYLRKGLETIDVPKTDYGF